MEKQVSIRIIDVDGKTLKTLYYPSYNEMIKELAKLDVDFINQDLEGYSLQDSFEVYLN